jgi:predicted ferric reductase
MDRIIFRMFAKSTTIEACGKIMEDGETIKLSMPIDVSPKVLGQSVKSGWKPTDHVFITVSALGKEHIFMAHPFTIASPAPREPGPADLEVIIRAQAGFSRSLLNYVHRHNKLTVRLDGPYGSTHARKMLEDSDLAVVIAGGSGIAVAWPLISHLQTLASSLHSEDNQQTERNKKIVLIWVIHQDTHASWLSTSSLDEARSHGVEIIIPKPTEEAGRPDLQKLIRDSVSEHAITGNERIGVVASGPDGMNRSVRNTCAGLIWNGRDVHVSVEKFGW